MKYKTVYKTIRRSTHSLKRITFRKFSNMLMLVYELKFRKALLRSKPSFMRINAYPHCNLKCPGCNLGRQNMGVEARSKQERIMALDEFKRCITPICDTLLRIVLYDEGEPLLHPDIFNMVSYADEQNVSVTISSNLSMPMSDERIEELVLSRLDHLIVAMDGTSQDVYAAYRVGGNLARVQENLKRIIAAKKRYKKKHPIIELQFLNFGFNSHQLPEAKRFAKMIGVNEFNTFKASPQPSLDKSLFCGTEEERIEKGCYHLWAVADINSDCELVPCDFGEDRDMSPVGSLLENDFNELWNSDYLVNLRKSFRRGNKRTGSEYCKQCRLSSAPPALLR